MPKRDRKGLTPNQQLNELQYSPAVFQYKVAADTTTAAVAFVAPFAMEIFEVVVNAQAASGSGTITPRKGATDAMCTAITCAVDGAVSRLSAGTVVANAARLILAKGDSVYVIANGSTDRGIVTFQAVRL